jgi:hypothetical protein
MKLMTETRSKCVARLNRGLEVKRDCAIYQFVYIFWGQFFTPLDLLLLYQLEVPV